MCEASGAWGASGAGEENPTISLVNFSIFAYIIFFPANLIIKYKKHTLERGTRPGSHRFLKDPLFFTSSVFLNTPRRVAALAMVMGLCLLVYTLGQRQLRQALAQEQETIPNQLGKPTESPTLRWVFQCFQAVHIVTVNCQKQVSNLTDARLWILRFLGSACQKYYLLC